MNQTKAKKEFEALFSKSIEEKNFALLQKSFAMDFFVSSTTSYKQSCMDYLVTSGYKNEAFAKWSLTNTEMGLRGDIHENADRPLRLAAKFNTEFAKYLLTSPELTEKANINQTNDGSSALLDAIQANNLEFVKYLLTSEDLPKKANIYRKNKDNPYLKAGEKS